jgi:hypothetical protein
MIPLNQEFIRDVLMPVAKSSRKVGKDFRRGRLHTFRHYFCSRLVANGFSELEIRMLMGHSISGMVAHDSHQDDPAVSERFARLPSLVNRKAVPDEPFRRQAVKENSTEERTSESPPETRKKRSEVKQGVAGGISAGRRLRRTSILQPSERSATMVQPEGCRPHRASDEFRSESEGPNGFNDGEDALNHDRRG